MTHDHPTQTLRAARLSAASLMLTSLLLASCGGGGGGGSPSPSPSPGVVYAIFSGDDGVCGGGCGGDGGGGGAGSGAGGDGGGGGLGEMRSVKVTVSMPDGTVLGSANLVNNLVSLHPGTYTGPVILEFADDGSGNGAYYDEGRRAWVTLGSTSVHALIPALTHHVSVNVLTEAAYQWVQVYTDGTTPTAADMTLANETVRAAFNARVPPEYQVSDITNYAVAVSDLTGMDASHPKLPNSTSGRYGTLLAAVGEMVSTHGSPGVKAPALEFIDQLFSDIQDDGTVNDTGALADSTYSVSLPQDLLSAVQNARAEYGVPEQPAPTTTASLCFNTALFAVGSTWNLDYQDTDASGTVTASTINWSVTRQTTFQGHANALEVQEDVGIAGTNILSYYDADLSNGLTNYGSTVTSANGSTVTEYNPPFTSHEFQLQPDSSESIDVSGTTNFYDPSGVLLRTLPISYTQITSFIGYQDVTLTTTGTTFKQACVFQTQDSTANEYTTSWVTSSGQGVAVKSTTTDLSSGSITSTSELTAGSVNGTPVR